MFTTLHTIRATLEIIGTDDKKNEEIYKSDVF